MFNKKQVEKKNLDDLNCRVGGMNCNVLKCELRISVTTGLNDKTIYKVRFFELKVCAKEKCL